MKRIVVMVIFAAMLAACQTTEDGCSLLLEALPMAGSRHNDYKSYPSVALSPTHSWISGANGYERPTFCSPIAV